MNPLLGDGVEPDQPLTKAFQQPGDALEVGDRGGQQVHPAVGVVDPVDGDFVDAQPGALGRHDQFGVEEPPVSVTWGSNWAATSARIALKPHCASLNRAASVDFRIAL